MAVRTTVQDRPQARTRSAPPAQQGIAVVGVTSGLALLSILLAIYLGATLADPGDGAVSVPLNRAVQRAFGWTAFLLPLSLVVAGLAAIWRALRPDGPPLLHRLTGYALLALALIPTVHLVAAGAVDSRTLAEAGQGGGQVGHLLAEGLVRLLGGPPTVAVLMTALFVGLLLLLDRTIPELAAALSRLVLRVAPVLGRFATVVARHSVRGLRTSWRYARIGLTARVLVPRPTLRRVAAVADETAAEADGSDGEPDWVRIPSAATRAPARPLAAEPATSTRVETPAPGEPKGTTRTRARPAAEPAPGPTASPTQPAPATLLLEPPGERQDPPGWERPAIDVFQARPPAEVSAADLRHRARVIEETLASFNVEARVVEMNQGPAVTQFGVEPGPGVAVNRILSRQNDLALRLGASPIRLEAPVPGKHMVGLEVPNSAVATVTLRDVVESADWEKLDGRLRLALGRDVSGKPIVGDLGRMPHLLIAGATGSGKSVCINTIVGSLLYQYTPDELQFVMIDPKRVELVGFAGVPHLRLPVITEMDRVVGALKWVVQEMDQRYRLFARQGARNLEGYNRWAREAKREDEPPLPYLVLVIDELADMMMTAAEEVERQLCRLAQLARATGIHLVVATQRPSVDVLTGLIKANFPTRIAFAVSSQTDSRVILDQAGAEKLLGRGDALYMPTDAMKPIRLQGAFVSDDEVTALVDGWKAQGGPRYTEADLEEVQQLGRGEEEDDEVWEKAVELAETVGRLSASLLQRRLGIGRDRAGRLLERLVEDGYAER